MELKYKLKDTVVTTVEHTREAIVTVDTEFIQIYKSFFSLLARMNTAPEVSILIHLIENCNKSNIINVTSVVYNSYALNIKAAGGVPVTNGGYKNLLTKLVDNQLIVRVSRGQYHINPLVLWKGNKGDRISQIKDLFENGSGKEYKELPTRITRTIEEI